MGKSKALETALNNKLLSSHEHLKKGVFFPPLYGGELTFSREDMAVLRQRAIQLVVGQTSFI